MSEERISAAQQHAHLLIDIASSALAETVLAPWVKETGPLEVARALVELARMADKDKVLKSAHAAYNGGDRSPSVVELEREYQRKRKEQERRIRRNAA